MFLFVLLGCSHKPIENGWSHGVVTQAKDFFASAFIITPDDDSVVLIDAGYNAKGKKVIAQLEEKGLSASDVTDIYITHGHEDHINGILSFPHAKISALATERDLLRESDIWLDHDLGDGDIVIMGSSELEVFALPGHTHGNAAYRVDDVLIMGDSAMAYRDDTLGPVAEKHSDDPALVEAALVQLGKELKDRSAEISWITFSHSGPLEGLAPLLDYQPDTE